MLSGNQENADSPSGYYIATDTVPVSEWLGFENVYQVHCPRLFLNESVRDVCVFCLEVAYLGSRILLDPNAVLLLFAFKERIRIPPGYTVSLQDTIGLTKLKVCLELSNSFGTRGFRSQPSRHRGNPSTSKCLRPRGSLRQCRCFGSRSALETPPVVWRTSSQMPTQMRHVLG